MAVERVSKRLKGSGEDKQTVVQLMPGHFNEQSNPRTLNLLGSSTRNSPYFSSSCGLEAIELESIEGDLLDLGQDQCLPPGLEKCLDLKTGTVYYLNSGGGTGLSSMTFPRMKSSGFNSIEEKDKRLDLKLNLSTSDALKSSRKNSSNYINNCSSDNSASEVESAMRLVGCQRCLMYYMVCRRDGSCPKCKGSFLVDFLDGDLSSS